MNPTPAQIGPVLADAPDPAQPRPVARTSAPESAPVPKQESDSGEPDAVSIAEPQEVVNVHTDTSTGEKILVYDFVDSQSGELIYQIPSQQMLDLARAIEQRFEQGTDKKSGEES